MNKSIVLGFFALCVSFYNYAQPAQSIRYKDFVFSELAIEKNIIYSDNNLSLKKNKYYRFDLYQPGKDSLKSRPLIIWMHGGGFKFGSKKAKGIRIWSKSFARRGYVCAAINYRLSKKNPLRNFSDLVNGCRDAVQDLTQAIEFFKQNHVLYGVDTNRIILGGHSAGAIIALHAVYSSSAKLMELVNNKDSAVNAVVFDRNNIAAIINFWGALFNTKWMENANVPIVSTHGKKDRIVPYRSNGSGLYGSFNIHQKADSLNIPNRLKTYDRFGHELQKHFIPILRSGATKRRWMDAGQFAADFIFVEVLK